MQELLKMLNKAKESLDNYYEIYKNNDCFNIKNSPKDYLEWIDKKQKLLLILVNLFKNQKNI